MARLDTGHAGSHDVLSALRAVSAAGLGERGWAEALTQAQEALGLRAIILTRVENRAGAYGHEVVAASAGTPLEADRLYRERFFGQGARAKTTFRAPPGALVHDGHIGPLAMVDRMPAYAEIFHPFDIGRFAALTVGQSALSSSRLILVALRANDAEAPDEALAFNIAALGQIAETSLNAHRALQALREAQAAAASALDHHPFAVFVLGAGGRVIQANRKARALAERRDGLAVQNGVLTYIDVRAGTAFARALQTGARETASFTAPRGKGPPFGVIITPARALGGLDNHASTLCVIVDPGSHETGAPALWRGMFGFTKAESAVAALFVQGLGPAEIAHERNVSEETIRTQTKRIYQKLGVRRQVAAAAMLTRASLGLPSED